MSLVKEYFLYTGSTDQNTFVLRTIPSSLHCRGVAFQGDVGGVSLCVVLADEERIVRTLNREAVDIAGKIFAFVVS